MKPTVYIMAAFFVYWCIAYPKILIGFLTLKYRDHWTDWFGSLIMITYGLGTIMAIVVYFR